MRLGLHLCAIAIASAMTSAQAATPGEASSLDPLVRPSQPSPRSASALMTAVALAGTRLVAVGERGTILASDDNGVTWKQQTSAVSVMLTGVAFATPQNGWAVGHSGVVLMTADGGATWGKQLDGVAVAQVVLKAAEAAVAAQDDDSTKKALTEAQQLVADGADKPFLDLLVDDERTVTVIGAYGLALRTEDGGSSWQAWQSRIPNAKGSHLYAIRRSGSAVYIAGEQGSVFRSTDGGQHYTALASPYGGSFFGAVSTAVDRAVVFGLRGSAYVTADGGATWTRSKLDTTASLSGGTVLNDGSVIVVSQAGNVLRSVDGGLTFFGVEVKAPVPFVAVAQAADGSLVMAGVRGVTRVVMTSLGGKR
jgi:photosystem II stability/assembly factor-like uncharacterized protein